MYSTSARNIATAALTGLVATAIICRPVGAMSRMRTGMSDMVCCRRTEPVNSDSGIVAARRCRAAAEAPVPMRMAMRPASALQAVSIEVLSLWRTVRSAMA